MAVEKVTVVAGATAAQQYEALKASLVAKGLAVGGRSPLAEVDGSFDLPAMTSSTVLTKGVTPDGTPWFLYEHKHDGISFGDLNSSLPAGKYKWSGFAGKKANTANIGVVKVS